MTFGEFFKSRRLRNGESLREFCARYRYDPGNISKLERGMFPPPESHEKLEEYAKCLGLRPATDDWLTFFDLAAVERGKIPQYIMDDKKVVAKLPLVFRTIKNGKFDTSKLKELADLIRRS